MENKIKELESDIRYLESENKSLESKIANKDDEIDELHDEISNLETEVDELKKGFHLEGIHANARMQSVIEEFFDNLNYIPVTEIENFVNTHKKIWN